MRAQQTLKLEGQLGLRVNECAFTLGLARVVDDAVEVMLARKRQKIIAPPRSSSGANLIAKQVVAHYPRFAPELKCPRQMGVLTNFG